MAQKFDIPDLLTKLAIRRPIFHSEADFQHELAMEIKTANEDVQLRLENPLEKGSSEALDILVRLKSTKMALELKYICAELEYADHTDGEEVFTLSNQAALDQKRFDVLKDVVRMERFVRMNQDSAAGVVVISNADGMWRGPYKNNTKDAEFSLREGREVSGKLKWAADTGEGTMKDREDGIDLAGCYYMKWCNYSKIGEDKACEFKFLFIPIMVS